ncbi:amino acid adenylation domain-containing protein [Kitasatospora sp. NA04385]|uniref:non-ribosomal peptide synthetase n=1 Tax=Kitasatospora sp. NA04385 TaxID=2742135 RepID=UPI00159286AD|nr:non-ribosomal peptide synthetase [Kitasatospora sp. NA04385]QKW23635.1 amino acid adenylation domain-containing protein [Kitasatospora sp. NA04385]
MEHPPSGTTAQDPRDLLGELAEHGVLVRSRRGRLVVDAPPATPGPLLERLTAARPEVLAAVTAPPGLPGPALPPDTPAPADAPFPLTDLQSAYHVGEAHYPQLRTPAHLAHGFEVPGLDLPRWTAALRTVLTRHETLRAALDPDGRQHVTELPAHWGPQVTDHRHLDADLARAAFLRLREHAADHLPPLDSGTQLGCTVHLAPDTAYVLLTLRLFALDARSIGLLCRDLAAAYEGRPLPGPTPPGLFRRYTEALDRHRDSQAHRNAVAHWTRRAAQLPPPPALPDTAVPAEARFARVRHRLPAPVWSRLRERARESGLSANTVLCAAYAELLRRWSGQPSFGLTVLVATRGMLAADTPGLDQCVGNFGSTLLLECDGTADTFTARAAALQQRLMADLPHVWLSGVEIARRARRTRPDATVASPFVFASGLDDTAGEALPPHLTADGWHLLYKAMHTPQVLLDHQVSEEDGELVCTFDHVADAFPDGLVAELAAAHADLLHRLADDPHTWTATHRPDLPDALLAARRAANRTHRPTDPGDVLDGLRTGAAHTPDRPALIGADGTVGYRQAATAATRTARDLDRAGARPGGLVGVLARKSPAQYLAALAALAHGSGYVPLGVDWPPARIAALLERHAITHLLTDDEGARLAAALPGPAAVTATALRPPAAADASGEGEGDDDAYGLPAQDPDALAYVIFTSGSTGTPKGVAIPHSGLLNTVQDMVERFGVGPGDRLLSLSELHFDLSAFDLFGALHAGAAVVVPPCGPRPDPELWARWVADSGATVWNTVPALLEMLLDHLGERAADVLGGLRLILLSGDWIPLGLPDRIRAACPGARLVALGGATEASIWSNYHVVEDLDPSWKSVPYGRPLANQRYHVLDAGLADVPHWVPGELYIAGDGLAAAYYGQPELTAERFPRHPRTGERLYRTGDHARYRPDGTLEFLGRVDSQAKVRGYRVDLLEVEQQLAAQPGVRAAACTVTGTGADSRLTAFVVPAEDGPAPDPAALRAGLAAVLPGYAVPGAFHRVPALPLTANGKRDARALLALAAEASRASEASETGGAPTGRPPRTDRERALARLWEQVCGTTVRSVDDDFFASGGSSVTAVRLLRLIGEEFGVRLPLSSLFEAGTVAGQCALLDRRGRRTLLTVRAGGPETVVLVHPVGGHLLGYRDLIEALPARFAVHGLQSPAAAELPGTLGELADEYAAAVAALGTPVHLLGWSLGGVLAAEIAHRLPDAPRSLTLVDSFVAAPAGPDGVPAAGEAATAADFFADHLGRGDTDAPDLRVPAGHPDPFGHLAARHLPDEPPQALRALHDQYRALYRLLLAHRPRPLPGRCPQTFVRAGGERPGAFPGLTPAQEHPGALVPPGTEVRTEPGTHHTVVRADAAQRLALILDRHADRHAERTDHPEPATSRK